MKELFIDGLLVVLSLAGFITAWNTYDNTKRIERLERERAEEAQLQRLP